MMIKEGDNVKECWRLLPILGPYILKDSFLIYCMDKKASSDLKIWELSRFAIETDSTSLFGFSIITLQSIDEIIDFGRQNGIDQFITVTTTALEQMIKRTEMSVKRF